MKESYESKIIDIIERAERYRKKLNRKGLNEDFKEIENIFSKCFSMIKNK